MRTKFAQYEKKKRTKFLITDIDSRLILTFKKFMIDDLNDKVTTAVSAVRGGIWSTREGIMFAGNSDRVEEELAEIKEEQVIQNENMKQITEEKREKNIVSDGKNSISGK